MRRTTPVAPLASRSISAFDLIILTMVAALMLFRVWRHQDAAPGPASAAVPPA